MFFNTNVLGFMVHAKVRDLNGNRIMSQCWFGSAEHGAALSSARSALATKPLS